MTEESLKGKYVYLTEVNEGKGPYKFVKAQVIRDNGKHLWLSKLISMWDGSEVNGLLQVNKEKVDNGYYCSSTFDDALTALEIIAGHCQDDADAMREAVTRRVDATFAATERVMDIDIEPILYPKKVKKEEV